MAIIYQRHRAYSLIVGDVESGEGFKIEDLHITFDITKSSNNKDRTNSATIEIYNLSKEKQKFLEKQYIGAVFSAGFSDTVVKELFSGQVTRATTRKNGTDVVSQIQIGSGYVELNHSTLSSLVTPGKTIRDVVAEIAKEIPGVSRTVFNGTNINSAVIDGYPLSGTARQMLDEISDAHAIDWQLDGDVLYVHDSSGTFTDNLNTAFVISSGTGMVDRPYAVSGDERRSSKDKAKVDGVQVKLLLNPEIVPGSIVQIEDENFGGFYKVASLRTYGQYRGNDWYTELRCEQKVG